ncbi:N-acetyl-1-D-myo-inositol-2-amino-2-deoxy-alpha-D-glucopyranoside deacetylase [Corynebacterium halotolerans]|uniref:1D-myo-inositol 2-acetamido-2-deoxy-alpha-D-glucopyranoside deacetylase n=1 Tax=Corynebacterium halotolerans YIM 70093 = DSM 44683 TaxID=1121362 RepID=M1NXA1_9CORY|nr:N-acetyl-1-D-myo-inositol-2-amino-2-deoxy-alpha-D-glucopyranoside deacetylase [Corynebacterium halotolerans]AGF72120.1 hypothetical protein A605_05570 [Corynebacterium halotolerans YIM 70093 = DSM 44683]
MSTRDRDLIGYRVAAVHAHPDDESITTGGVLADLAARGADVTVITCTLGEEGEVIGETYAGLAADGGADQLGGFRVLELRAALDHLGVRGIHLGGAGRYRDSGMAGSPAHANPRAFVNSGERAVDELAGIFGRLRPHLVITYDPHGGYGHPDHIRAHEITHAAAQRIDAEHRIPRILWTVTPRDELEAGLAAIGTIPAGWRPAGDGELASVDRADLALDLDDHAFAAKREAMRAHATQIWFADGTVTDTNPEAARASVSDPDLVPAVWALSNLIAQPLLRREHFQFAAGVPLPPTATGVLDGIVRG